MNVTSASAVAPRGGRCTTRNFRHTTEFHNRVNDKEFSPNNLTGGDSEYVMD